MNTSKKVAFVMPWHISERGGGAEVQANYLAIELANRGFDVYYICQTNHANKINSFEIINSVNIYWLKPSGRFAWLDQNKYYKPLNAIKPEIVIQRMSSNINYVIGNYCKRNNVIYNWVCTDNLNPYKNFHVKKFKDRFSLKNISLLKYVIFLLNAKVMDYYRNVGMTRINYGFSQNEIQKKGIKSSFGINTYQMITGHPMPLDGFSSKERFSFKTVLWCANFGAHKRPELFIELARRMQHTALNFIMVGGHNNKAYVEHLLIGKPPNLYCTGQLPFEKALSYFDNSSVFINTSSPEGDGFPNTFVQAWLRKTPIITFGFDPDAIIEQNQLGFNVTSLDEAINKMTIILSDYEVYKSISDNAYTYGSKNHSIKIMADNFLKVIENEGIALS